MSEILEYKCPCCGGDIQFDPAAQKMKCPYCDTEFEIETLKALEKQDQEDLSDDFSWDQEDEKTWQEEESENIGVYICNSCGGQIIGDAQTAAMSCPFCGSPVIFSRQVSGDLKPDLIIPFQLDKAAAKEKLKQHLSGKPLLPKVFKEENHLDEIKGIYVPFWLFDADVQGDVRFRGTKIRAWSDPDYDYTETSFFRVLRRGEVGFQAVPVDGSSKMPDTLMESLEPYDLSQAVDFETAYLAGYLADRYDVGEKDSTGRANQRMKKSTEDSFASTALGYSSLTIENSSVRLFHAKARYALYPVWILHTTWKDQKFTFAMNGQTGKFVGDLPMDSGAFWRWLLGLFAAGAGTAFFICFILGFLGI